MNFLKRGALLSALLAASTLAACSNDHISVPAGGATPTPVPTTGPTQTPSPVPTATPTATPTPKPAAIAYTAVGASDAVGYGASVPCNNPPLVAIPTCPAR